MICPMCQATSPTGARFCTGCGAALPRCRGCGAPVSLAHKFCPACGGPVVTGPLGMPDLPAGGRVEKGLVSSSSVEALASIAPARRAHGDPLLPGTEARAGVRALLHVQVAIPAGAEEEARRFYAGLLGLEEIPKPPSLRGRGGLWYRVGALELHLGVESDFRPARKAHPAFAVDHLERLRRHLERHGVATRDDTALPDRARFYCEDPFGNRLEFVQQPEGE